MTPHYRFLLETEYPIAFDSPDHLSPWGTKADNHTSHRFIIDIENTFSNRPLSFMDLGCSGGLLVHDMIRRGHFAVGLEGSDYSLRHNRAEWPMLANKHLFTCDVSRQYKVFLETAEGKNPFACDMISAWEVVEHIHPDRMVCFLKNIRDHLKTGGHFYSSISLVHDCPKGMELHLSVFPKEQWDTILDSVDGLKQIPYPYPARHAVRNEPTSILIALKRS